MENIHWESVKHLHGKYKIITNRILCLTTAALALAGLLLYTFILVKQMNPSSIIFNGKVFYYYLAVQITFYGMYVIINLFVFVFGYALPNTPTDKLVIVQMFNNNNILFTCSIINKVAYVVAIIIYLAERESPQLTDYFNFIMVEFILFIIMVYIIFNTNTHIREMKCSIMPCSSV
jgi:hypothetical protein